MTQLVVVVKVQKYRKFSIMHAKWSNMIYNFYGDHGWNSWVWSAENLCPYDKLIIFFFNPK